GAAPPRNPSENEWALLRVMPPRRAPQSIRPDVRVRDDRAEALRLLLHARVQLGRARGDGVNATAGEALLHVGHVEDLDDLGVELVDDRLRRGLGRKQRGPV